MPQFDVTALVGSEIAGAVQSRLGLAGVSSQIVEDVAELGRRETRFMGRIVLIIVAWSVIGTALGVGLGVLIAQVFGPDGTDGMIIQGVSWAVFAHLLAGMFAGYYLLADRTREELPIPGADSVLVVVECASIDETNEVAQLLREFGATNVSVSVDRRANG